MAYHLHNIVLVGVGGAGMSSLARLCVALGYERIIGIDAAHGQMTDALEQLGLEIRYGSGVYDVQPHDVVIYSDIEAIRQTPELQQSFAYQQQHLKHHHRPRTYNELIAELSKLFITIAISGTNGKSSTTALAISLLQKTLPDYGLGILGALLPEYDQSNMVLGSSSSELGVPTGQVAADMRALVDQIFVGTLADPTLTKKYHLILEACEHKQHLLMYDMDYLLLTNIGYDHQDYYTTQQQYDDTFVHAMQQTRHAVIVPAGETSIERALSHSSLPADYVQDARDKLIPAAPRTGEFDHVFGSHRAINAGLVAQLSDELIGDVSSVIDRDQLIASFGGLGRRMELLGTTEQGAIVYTDYGHHPEAIQYAIDALRTQYPDHTLTALIEPHQAQRLLSLWQEFGEVVQQVDRLVVVPIYHAREQRSAIQSIMAAAIPGCDADGFEQLGHYVAQQRSASYCEDIDACHDYLSSRGVGDVVICLTAGQLDSRVRSYMR